MKNRIVWAIIASVLVLASCSTSQGSLFSLAMESDEEAKPSESGYEEATVEEDPPGIYVYSDPSGVSVYVNGREMGTTPLELTDIPSGVYRISVDAYGYYPQNRTVSYSAGTIVVVDMDLEEITGYLDLDSNIPGTTFVIDGSEYEEGVAELRIGNYYVEAVAFGYEPYGIWVDIEERRTTRVDALMEEAEFAVSDVWIERRVFSPKNPYSLGSAVLRFRVSAPGIGSLTITDANGTVVKTHDFPEFDTWEQSLRWYGRADSGAVVPDGTYVLEIKATGTRDGIVDRGTETAEVDSAAVIAYRTSWSGTSGMLYAGTAEVLPPWSFQFDIRSLGHRESGLTFLPSQAAFRLGLPGNAELNVQGTGYFIPEWASGWTAGIGYKKRLVSDEHFQVAVETHATFGPGAFPGNDALTNFPGFSVGLPFTVRSGNFGLTLMPEAKLSWTTPVYGAATPPSGDFFPWLYGRAGIFYDRGPVMFGVSSAIRTTSWQEGFDVDWPLAAGAEVNWFIPGTQLVLSANAAMEYAPDDPATAGSYETFYVMGGVAFGILN